MEMYSLLVKPMIISKLVNMGPPPNDPQRVIALLKRNIEQNYWFLSYLVTLLYIKALFLGNEYSTSMKATTLINTNLMAEYFCRLGFEGK